MNFPQVVNVIYEGDYTHILWSDDTITTVKKESKDSPCFYTAFAFAVLKKVFGTTFKAFRECDKKSIIPVSPMSVQKVRERISSYKHTHSTYKTVARFERVSFPQFHKDSNILYRSDATKSWGKIKLPTRKTKGSAGYDFIAYDPITIYPHSSVVISTGIKCQLCDGYVLMLYPRSGLGFKYGVHLSNTVGVIDSDYYNNEDNEGHIKVKLTNPSDETIFINEGQGFAQGIITEYFYAEEDIVTKNRSGGFGSTDNQ